MTTNIWIKPKTQGKKVNKLFALLLNLLLLQNRKKNHIDIHEMHFFLLKLAKKAIMNVLVQSNKKITIKHVSTNERGEKKNAKLKEFL